MKSAILFLAGAIVGCVCAIGLVKIDSKPDSTITKELRETIARQEKEIADQRKEFIGKIAPAQSGPPEAAPAPGVLPEAPSEKPKSSLEGLAAFVDNPAMKKMLATQQRQMIEENFEELIGRFQFNAAERKQFTELLVAKEMVNMDFGLKMLKVSPDERKDLGEQMREAHEKAEDDLREFFNDDDDYKIYEDYEKQMVHRSELKSLEPEMVRINQPLSADQQKSLLAIMETEHAAVPESADPDDPTLMPEAMDGVMAEQEKMQARIAGRAAAVLTPAQLEVFRMTQVKSLEMMKVGIEMSRTLFSEPSPTPAR